MVCGSGMSLLTFGGMASMLTKRGRPEFTDRSTIKSRAMTIVLTEDTLIKLDQMATNQKRKKATLARIMIEQQVETNQSKWAPVVTGGIHTAIKVDGR